MGFLQGFLHGVGGHLHGLGGDLQDAVGGDAHINGDGSAGFNVRRGRSCRAAAEAAAAEATAATAATAAAGAFRGDAVDGGRAGGPGLVGLQVGPVAGIVVVEDGDHVAVIQRQVALAVIVVGDVVGFAGLQFELRLALEGQGHVLVEAEGARVVEPETVFDAASKTDGTQIEDSDLFAHAVRRHGDGFPLVGGIRHDSHAVSRQRHRGRHCRQQKNDNDEG